MLSQLEIRLSLNMRLLIDLAESSKGSYGAAVARVGGRGRPRPPKKRIFTAHHARAPSAAVDLRLPQYAGVDEGRKRVQEAPQEPRLQSLKQFKSVPA